MEAQRGQLEAEELRRKVVEDDMMWLHQKGVVKVVNKAVESAEFSLGVRRMKATCVVAGVEGGKQTVIEQVTTGMFNPGELSVIVELNQAMHAYVKAFMEMDFASYLCLGELDLGSLCQLCNNPDVEDVPPEHDPSKASASSDSLGK